MMSGMGIVCEDIARVIGISEPTMRKHYRSELETGFIYANAQVAQSLFRQATDKTKPNVIAAIFWLKTRAGWKEAQSLELGKKEQKEKAAKSASAGVFSAPSAPLKLIKNGIK